MQSTAHIKTEIFTNSSLFLEFPDDRSLRIDREGRWSTWQSGDALFRRTLDSRIVRLNQGNYSMCADDEAVKVRNEIQQILQEVQTGDKDDLQFQDTEESRKLFEKWIHKSLEWLQKPSGQEIEKFQKAYPENIQILPPDRYRDIVIQPARGCPYAQCTFCAFYKNHQFRVLTDEEFEEHIHLVEELLGSTISQRTGIFLDSASALSLSQRRMKSILERLSGLFPNLRRGVAAFLDPDHSPMRSIADYRELAGLGLSQATIGLETGFPELRSVLGKNGDLGQVKESIQTLKNAGIQIALTILIGAGGEKYLNEHKEMTIQFIHDMELTKRDLIYLSPLAGSLSAAKMEEEMSSFKWFLKQQTNARILPYHMERFFYFS